MRPPSRGLAFPCLQLSPIVSPHVNLCWMVRPRSRGLISTCPIVSPHVCLCWMVCPPSQGLVSSCLVNGVYALPRSCLPFSPMVCPLSRMVSLLVVSAFPRSCLPLSPLVSRCLPSCFLSLDGASAFSRSHLPCSPIISPHVCLCWMVCPPSRGLVSPCLPLSPLPPLPPISCLPWSPIVSPTNVNVLDGVSALRGVSPCLLCLPLSPRMCLCRPLVSNCQLSPHTCACVGWCVRLLEVLSPLVSHCLPSFLTPCLPLCSIVSHYFALPPIVSPCVPLFPIVSPHVCLCWMMCPPSRGLVSHCLPPIVSCWMVSPAWMVCPPSLPLSPHVPMSPIVSDCLPHMCACLGWCARLPKVLSLLSLLSPSLSVFLFPFVAGGLSLFFPQTVYCQGFSIFS